MSKINIVNVSGGVDSTACYLLALEERERTGEDFRAVFADTGNEHDMTIAYVNELAAKTGRGGMQYSMEALMEPMACSPLYGLCE